MKKLHLLKTMLLLCALIVGSGTMWADTYSYTFNASSGISKGDNTLSGVTWNINHDSQYNANEAAGYHVGSGSKSVSYLQLSTSGISGTISKVVANAKGNGSGGTISVTVNGNAYSAKNNDNAITSSSKDFEFTGSSTGTIVIRLAYATAVKNNFYISSIEVTYSSGPTTYSVTYDGNGNTSGDVPEDDNEYEKDDKVTVLGNTGSLTKTGYAFGGWNTQNDGEGTNYTAGDTFTISANTTLYAKWNAYTVTAKSNNNTLGTVSASGYVITAAPAEGSRYASPAYTVSPGTATVAQDGNEFTVTPSSDCTVTINFEAIPTYTVTFNAEGGSCATTSATETIGGAGVTLPAATIDLDGWVFAGWATAPTASTPTRPTLYKSGRTYYPTANTTLHAVYTLDGVNYEKYQRATTLEQITSASQIAIVNASKILDNKLGGVSAPEETDGFIDEPSSDYIWTLSGDNTDGFTLTNGGKTIGTAASLPSSYGNLQLSSNHNSWLFAKSTNGDNNFVVKNKELNSDSKVGSIEYNSSWKIYFLSSASYTGNYYVASKIYIPVSTVFNSNPTQAIITPVVSFNSTDAKTLYLDGTKTYTNAASVTGVDKPITYSSSDVSVATVNASGVVTAVGIGTATITASVAAELGVNKAASDTYEITVKNTTTIAGLKALYDAAQSPAKAFAADLTDAVVTYVNGNHAYIQDATGAIYASCGSSLTAGKKINGAVSGTITAPNKIDEIKTIDLSAATVTEDGIIPAAEVKTLAQIKAGDYDGKLVTVNGATVSTGMNNATSGGVITDDGGTTTVNIIAPNKLTLKATEIGNFTGFVSTYVNGLTTTYRLNLYDASQYQKTRNVETAQTLSFANNAVALDEVTSELTAFTGQAVSGAHTTVTYSKVDESSIIGEFNTETGALALNGKCGTATITATAAEEEVEDAGVTTPYLEATKSYTITVSPRYMVTFSVNGVETVLRQATSDASINVPTPAAVGDYKFRGWSTSTVAPTDEEPSMASVGATITPANNDTKYYAVFAKGTAGGEQDELSTLTFKSSTTQTSPYVDGNDVTWTFNNKVVFANSNSCGLYSGSEVTITLPESAIRLKNVTLTQSQGWSQTKASVTLKNGDDLLHTFTYNDSNYDFVSNYKTCTLNSTGNGNAWTSKIEVTYAVVGITYSDYRTSLPTVAVTITDSKFATFCYARELSVDGTAVTAYTASANGEGESVTLTKINDGIIPANTGVILYAVSAGTYEINVSETGKEAIAGNELVGVTTRTSIPETSAGKYNYILSKKNDVVGFYRASGAYLLPNRAYLSTTKRDVAAREFMGIIFDDETVTRIEAVEKSQKIDGKVYNLNGQLVENPTKGLYIVNGRKVVIK